VTRTSNDPSRSWVITKRFREFDDLNNILKEFGFELDLPRKKFLGSTDRIFMAERQKGLQVCYLNNFLLVIFNFSRHISIHSFNNLNFVIH
jgi:hypothetical protein